MTSTPDSAEDREQVVASLVQGYRDGQSIRALATASGRSYGFVQSALRQAGVAMRPRGVVVPAPAITTVIAPPGVPDTPVPAPKHAVSVPTKPTLTRAPEPVLAQPGTQEASEAVPDEQAKPDAAAAKATKHPAKHAGKKHPAKHGRKSHQSAATKSDKHGGAQHTNTKHTHKKHGHKKHAKK